MRKFFWGFAIISLTFLFACKDSATSSTSTSENSQNEKNKTNTKEVNKALQTGDVSKLDSFIDKDIVDHGDPKGDVKGLDNVKKRFVEMHNSLKDVNMESFNEATEGDYHYNYYHITGTTTDASMGMPAGTKMDRTGINMVKMKNGKAVEHWTFVDVRDMMKMSGGMDHSKMNSKDSTHK